MRIQCSKFSTVNVIINDNAYFDFEFTLCYMSINLNISVIYIFVTGISNYSIANGQMSNVYVK